MSNTTLTSIALLAGIVCSGCSKDQDQPPAPSSEATAVVTAPTAVSTASAAASVKASAAATAQDSPDGAGDEDSDEEPENGDEDSADSQEGSGDSASDVKIKTVGLRISGSKADKNAKGDIVKALEAHHEKLADCYGKVKTKGKGGTFGVDIRIDRKGAAKVKQVRTRINGKPFQQCVIGELERIEFPEPPGKKPIMVSYSFKFQMEGEK